MKKKTLEQRLNDLELRVIALETVSTVTQFPAHVVYPWNRKK